MRDHTGPAAHVGARERCIDHDVLTANDSAETGHVIDGVWAATEDEVVTKCRASNVSTGRRNFL
jgi:hypothetical protein